MLGKKMVSLKKFAKKVMDISQGASEPSHHECLLREFDGLSSPTSTPTGFFVLYVGEYRERIVAPTSFLSHPLFKMLLEKAYNEFDLEQNINRLVVPFSVSTFQELVNAVESCNGRFDLGNFVEELI